MVFSKSPYEWNCVDVLGNDGKYRFGRVVDVADNEKGLIVDICCADQRREMIPFSKVFHASYGRKMCSLTAYYYNHNVSDDEDTAQNPDTETDDLGPEVEVLVREHLSGPWIWWPGRLLTSFSRARNININKLAQVEWHSADGKKNVDIFPCICVRKSLKGWKKNLSRFKTQPSGAPQCVTKNSFNKHRVRLEETTAFLTDSVSKKEFLRLLTEFVHSDDDDDKWPWTTDFKMDVVFVDIVDGHLHYMTRPKAKPEPSRMRSRLLALPEGSSRPEKEPKIIEIVDEVLRFMKRDAKEKARALHMNTVRVLNREIHPRKVARIQTLPPEIIGEILSYPDTITKTRLQRVCRVWTTLLSKNAKLNDTIWIADSPFWERDWIKPDYVIVSTIVKNLSPAIKRIMLTYGSPRWVEGTEYVRWFDGELLTAAGSIHYVSVTGVPVNLKELLLHRWNLTFQTGLHQDPQLDCEAHGEPPDDLESERYVPYNLPYFFLQCAALEHKYLHCQELSLVNCRVTLFHLTLDEDKVLSNNPERSHLTFDEDKEVSNAELGHCKVEIVINVVRGSINLAGGHFDCALWELLDSSLPVPDRRQKKLVTRWIRWLTENQDSERKQALLQMTLKILCEVQTCDPRKTLQYRGKMWCKDGLKGIKLNKLSRITMHFLIKLTAQFPETDDQEVATDPDE
ncbi:uncharacterized protein LOC129583266 [Paramacrobiotus metropolitanus]|uniref:uncharacterized protein LOC129583266 n=1 Tax=Paramacrobiotus metropolitanus TaxID=2943436 RepID=UPI0024458749|nr:uncharacterized protein LOC129583266 [Paramacrobiotus metropolitanus]